MRHLRHERNRKIIKELENRCYSCWNGGDKKDNFKIYEVSGSVDIFFWEVFLMEILIPCCVTDKYGRLETRKCIGLYILFVNIRNL